MRLAKLISLAGVLAMGGVLLYAITSGDFAEDGRRLLALPWGVVSLVDLYVGFSLFSLWIIYRENAYGRSLIWILLVMVLGFFAASLYTFIALQASGGSWERFWQGRRARAD